MKQTTFKIEAETAATVQTEPPPPPSRFDRPIQAIEEWFEADDWKAAETVAIMACAVIIAELRRTADSMYNSQGHNALMLLNAIVSGDGVQAGEWLDRVKAQIQAAESLASRN